MKGNQLKMKGNQLKIIAILCESFIMGDFWAVSSQAGKASQARRGQAGAGPGRPATKQDQAGRGHGKAEPNHSMQKQW